MVSSLLSAGSSGLMRSYTALQKNSQQMAAAAVTQNSSTLNSSAVAQQALLTQAMADVQLVSTAGKMLGSVINTTA